MGKIVHQPFDKLLKSTLQNKERAREFLKVHLPDCAKQYVDLEGALELVDKEFIKGHYKSLRCDIIYSSYN